MEFTDEQAARIHPRPDGVCAFTARGKATRIDPPLLTLETPVFDEAAPFDPTKELHGSVIVRGLDGLNMKKYSLRLTYRGPNVSATTHCIYEVIPVTGSLRFRFTALGAERVPKALPAIAFFDVCRTRQEPGQQPVLEVLSNTVGVILDFKDPPGAAAGR
jgi:hypothetical protein